MVQSVEHLGAKLHLETLCYDERLEEIRIQIVGDGGALCVAACIAGAAGKRRKNDILGVLRINRRIAGLGVDVASRARRVGYRADTLLAGRVHVRAVVGPADAVGIETIHHRKRHAGFNGVDAGNLPAAQNPAQRSLLALHERQFVVAGHHKALLTVKQRKSFFARQAAEDGGYRRSGQHVDPAGGEGIADVVNRLGPGVRHGGREVVGKATVH